MIKPNDFCVSDVNYHCVWGSRTSWDALNEIQKEKKDKIVFSGTVEERGEGSRYAWFRDDEAGINYLIAIQKRGKQSAGLSIEMTEFLDEMVPKELCTIDRYGDVDDFVGCGNCFSMENAESMDEDCQGCIVNKMFQEYAKEQKRQNQVKAERERQGQIFETAVQTWGKEKQTDMMIEEMAELTKAILNERRGRNNNIAEEMADVRIMLEQMAIIFQNIGEVERIFREKIARLNQRLNNREGASGI